MKTLIKILISLTLIYTPIFANAGAAEKWDLVENVYDTSRDVVKLTARKVGQASNDGVYKVTVPVSSSTLGASIKTMLWAGVAVAGVQAMLEGIGWIIDTSTKTIKRQKEVEGDPHLPYFWCASYYKSCSSSASAAASMFQNELQIPNISSTSSRYVQSGNYHEFKLYSMQPDGTSILAITFNVYWTQNPNYVPDTPPPEWEIMTDAQLGNETKGKGEHPIGAPDVIPDVYDPNGVARPDPTPAAKEADKALDSQNPEPEKNPESVTKPEIDEDGNPTGNTKTEWPAACDWWPSACVFFKVSKEYQDADLEQNKTFFEKVTDWFDWSKQDSDLPENEKPEIIELPVPDLKEDAINWNSQCPADVQIPINLQGVSSTITFSWSPWCQLLDVIKPAIIASAYIGAAFIVLGLRT